MATIENVGCFDQVRVDMMNMSRETLIAQQMVVRGAIDALTALVHRGGSKDVAEQMLADSKETLCIVHEVANARGLQLVGYR